MWFTVSFCLVIYSVPNTKDPSGNRARPQYTCTSVTVVGDSLRGVLLLLREIFSKE